MRLAGHELTCRSWHNGSPRKGREAGEKTENFPDWMKDVNLYIPAGYSHRDAPGHTRSTLAKADLGSSEREVTSDAQGASVRVTADSSPETAGAGRRWGDAFHNKGWPAGPWLCPRPQLPSPVESSLRAGGGQEGSHDARW